MKLPMLLLLLIATQHSLFSQKNIPDYGKVDRSELEMKECEFEKKAPAMVLYDEGIVFCNLNLSTPMYPITELTERRVRIKIFNSGGLEYANIKIPYNSKNNNETIQGLSAQTYNLDATGNIVVTKLEKSQVFDKKINSRRSEKIFALSDVKEGSIIEYKYKVEGRLQADWYFQKKIPVKYSSFTIDFPQELIVNTTPHCSLPLQEDKKNKSTRNILLYSMNNIPSLPDEPYMSNLDDYLQRLEARIIAVEFPGEPRQSLILTWPGVIKDLLEDPDFGLQLKKNIPRTSDLDRMLLFVSDTLSRMDIIYRYVRDHMQWNDLDNIWALDGVKSAWKDQKGTSGEINLILINLLKDGGLNARPLLVSTRENGAINTAVAGYGQFDKVMAYVTIGNENYILDATDKYTPSWIIPSSVLASEGLLIDRESSSGWGWKTIWDPTHSYKNSVFIQAEMDEKGSMNGTTFISSYDYARIEKTKALKKGDDNFLKNLTGDRTDIRADSLTVTNKENDSLPLMQSFNFVQSSNNSGDYRYFSANLFSGFEKNIFLEDERNSDIFFGTNRTLIFTGVFSIPKTFSFEPLPKNIRMMTPDSSIVFRRICTVSTENILTVRINLDFLKPVYGVEEYPAFREFYKKLFGLMNDQFVLKKK